MNLEIVYSTIQRLSGVLSRIKKRLKDILEKKNWAASQILETVYSTIQRLSGHPSRRRKGAWRTSLRKKNLGSTSELRNGLWYHTASVRSASEEEKRSLEDILEKKIG